MNKHDLAKQLDHEIEQAEKSLAFWNEQVTLQASSPLVGTVKGIAERAEATLQGLKNAREVFGDA